MNNAVNWFEIYTTDFDRAKRFYSEVFQYSLTDIPIGNDRHTQMLYATFPLNINGIGACGALVKLDVAKPGIGGTMVYFATKDITTELNRVPAAGGKIIRGKQQVGEFGFIALVEDTEGNMIGLRSDK